MIFSLAISILFLSSCVLANPKKSSIIKDPSRSTPCWENITPGKTTSNEVYSVLKSIKWIDINSIQSKQVGNDYESIFWTGIDNSGDDSGDIYITNNKVFLLSISPHNELLQVDEIINKFGAPESVLALYAHGEKSIMGIYFLYLSKGYIFLDYYYVSNFRSEVSVKIRSDEEIITGWYGESTSIQKYLSTGPIDNIPIDLLTAGIQKWTGYGDYTFIDRFGD